MKKVYIINGKNFSNMKEFYKEIQKNLTKDFKNFGNNLDALDDVLYGGFGKFAFKEKIILIWDNFEKSEKEIDSKTLNKIIRLIKEHKNISLKTRRTE